jgi:hypothetical protein
MRKILALIAILALSGCAAQRVIETHVVEKPGSHLLHGGNVAMRTGAYPVDRVSPADDAPTIDRAAQGDRRAPGLRDQALR